jgi:hypothetical protein
VAESDVARYNSPSNEIEKRATRAESIMRRIGVCTVIIDYVLRILSSTMGSSDE